MRRAILIPTVLLLLLPVVQHAATRITTATEGIETAKDESQRPFPLSGRINLLVDALSYEHLEIAPLRFNVQFEPQKIAAQVVEANLCGIDLLTSAQIVSGEIEISLPIRL